MKFVVKKSRLFALIRKELHQIIKDPSSLIVTFILPSILLFIYGCGVSLDYKNLAIGLVLEDTTPVAQSFAKALTDSRYFSVSIEREKEPLYHQLIEGKLKGVVVVPSWFSSFLGRKSQTAPIQVIADGSDPNTANFVQNYVAGAFQNWLIEEKKQAPHQAKAILEPRYWFNEELESRFFLVPGSIALIMTLIGTLLTSLVIAREWERGTMESLMATPVTIYELLIAKFISYFGLGMLSFFFSTFVALFLFDVPLRGSFLLLTFVTVAFLFIALGMGLLISTVAKNQFVASQAALISAFLPAFMLSGFLFEIASMPWVIRLVTAIIPAKYYVTCLQTLFLAGNAFSLILQNLLIMIVIGIFLFFWIAKKTKKRLD